MKTLTKQVSFSFKCDQDPMKMPAHGQTRHCSQCERNIHDFTGMSAEQIAQTIKTSAKPCGFMLPWQLNEVNEHLRQQRSDLLINRLGRLAKIAAMFSAPFMVTQAYAQEHTIVNNSSGPKQGKDSEIALTCANGTPLVQTAIEVINSQGEILARLTTDASGRIYLDKNLQGTLVLRNAVLGLEKTIHLGHDPVCIVWHTMIQNITETAQPEHHYSFSCVILKDEKQKKLARTKVSVILYDSTNTQLGTLELRTNSRGALKINDSNLINAAYLSFQFETNDGIKSTYSNIKDLDLVKTNELMVYDYEERFTMGIMVAE